MPLTQDDLFELTISGDLAGQFVQNVFHARVTHDTTDTNFFTLAQDVAKGWRDEVLPAYVACLPGVYSASSLRCRAITPSGGPTATITGDVGGVVGTRGDNIVTQSVGPLLLFPVFDTRWVWGKMFLPGIASDDCIDHNIVSALLLLLEALGGAMLGWDGDGAEICNLAIKHATGTTYAVPTDSQVSPTIGTQRRRCRPTF